MMHAILTSAELHAHLREITGAEYELEQFFFSRYSAGDFLGAHSDSVGMRKLAFVMHFCNDWSPSDGGLLLFTDPEDTKVVEHAFVPRGNTFNLFDVSQQPPFTRLHTKVLNHMVTEVAHGLRKQRIAASGWFRYAGS